MSFNLIVIQWRGDFSIGLALVQQTTSRGSTLRRFQAYLHCSIRGLLNQCSSRWPNNCKPCSYWLKPKALKGALNSSCFIYHNIYTQFYFTEGSHIFYWTNYRVFYPTITIWIIYQLWEGPVLRQYSVSIIWMLLLLSGACRSKQIKKYLQLNTESQNWWLHYLSYIKSLYKPMVL